MVQITGLASHAGTTPMGSRRDAAAAAAEFMVALETAATGLKDCVATVGQLQVVNGSTNVVPGHVSLSLDLRAPTNDQRDGLVRSTMELLASICKKRGVSSSVEQTLLASAAPLTSSSPVLGKEPLNQPEHRFWHCPAAQVTTP